MRVGTAAPWASRMYCRIDRLSTLPDEILQQILSFLPAQEAVRTCVLAQSWRHVWKLTRQLRITGILTRASVLGVRKFVRHIFLLRFLNLTKAPLDLCEIIFHEFDDEDITFMNIWIKWAIMCKIQTFHLDLFRNEHDFPWFEVDDEPLISSYLTKIQLSGIMLSESFADFSRCPVLQDLQIIRCDLSEVRKLMSSSLKCLVITECTSAQNSRLRIWVPHLVSLHLDEPSMDRTPLLESMPELVEAYVKTYYWNMDSCSCCESMDCNHIMGASSFSDSDTDDDFEVHSSDDADKDIMKSVLLGGLSQATNLTLLSGDTMYIFRRDLRWCPTFFKLKSLLLNDYWCEAADCRALACILQHAPVLEKLSIIFSDKVDPNYKVEIKGCLDDGAMKRSLTISEYLKIIEVKCNVVNERFLKLLKFLQSSLNICFYSEQ
ncbi:hypothetical protein EJB05_29005, partial [Eragrostis curvula]